MATYVTSDIHGCYKSLTNLLKFINFDLDNDVMICAGDIIDKGPNSNKCLDFFLNNNYPIVLGNHCEWIPRHVNGNKLKLNNWRKDTIKQLGDKIGYYAKAIEKFPLYIQIQHPKQGLLTLVHAGIEPNLPIEEQHKNIFLRIRDYPHVAYDPLKKEVGKPWQNSYTIPFAGTIIHGHAVCSTPQWHGNPYVYSLDGGCVYGNTRGFQGVLRCIRIDDMKIFEVAGDPSEVKHYLSLS